MSRWVIHAPLPVECTAHKLSVKMSLTYTPTFTLQNAKSRALQSNLQNAMFLRSLDAVSAPISVPLSASPIVIYPHDFLALPSPPHGALSFSPAQCQVAPHPALARIKVPYKFNYQGIPNLTWRLHLELPAQFQESDETSVTASVWLGTLLLPSEFDIDYINIWNETCLYGPHRSVTL